MSSQVTSGFPVVMAIQNPDLRAVCQTLLEENNILYAVVSPLELVTGEPNINGDTVILLEAGKDIAFIMQIVLNIRRYREHEDTIISFVEKNVMEDNFTFYFWMLDGMPAIDVHLSLSDTSTLLEDTRAIVLFISRVLESKR